MKLSVFQCKSSIVS